MDRFLSLDEVERTTSLKKSKIYEMVRAGKFPAQKEVTKRRRAWLASEVQAWVASRALPRNGTSTVAEATMFDLACPDWAVARVDCGWQTLAGHEWIPDYLSELGSNAGLNPEDSGLSLVKLPIGYFHEYGGSKIGPKRGGIKWQPMLLIDINRATFKGVPVACIAPVWLHHSIATLHSRYAVPEALAKFVPPRLGSRDVRTVMVREFLAAADEFSVSAAKRLAFTNEALDDAELSRIGLKASDWELAEKVTESARR